MVIHTERSTKIQLSCPNNYKQPIKLGAFDSPYKAVKVGKIKYHRSQEDKQMKAAWRDYNNRKWNANKEQEKFEKLLIENGFTIEKIKESCTKSEYQTIKDNVEIIFTFNTEDNAKDKITACLKDYEILVENIRLKQELARRKK